MRKHRTDVVYRNYVLNLFEGGSYISSTGFISPQTVLPVLVARLGGSNVAVGAIVVISFAGQFIPQIFSARYAEASPWKKPGTIWFGFCQRVVMLVIGVVILLFGGRFPAFALVAFLVLYALNQMFSGLTTPFWFDFIAKLTPGGSRGRLVGMRTSLGGVGAFIGGILLTYLLFSFDFPVSYALGIFIAAALQFTSLGFQARVREEEPTKVEERIPLPEYLRALRGVMVTNRDFRRFMIAMILNILGSMPVAFFGIYALRTFRSSEAIVGQFTITMLVAQIASGMLNGIAGDRYGHKVPLLIAGTSMAAASLVALVSPSVHVFLLVFLLVGVNLGTEVMSRYNMAIEYCPVRLRSTYIGLMNTLLAPFYAAGMIGGCIVDAFGYPALFVIGFVFAAAGASATFLFVQNTPRRRTSVKRLSVVAHE